MNDTRSTAITAADLLGLRVPLDTTLAPGAARLAFMLSESDFDKSEVRTQLFESSLSPRSLERAEHDERRRLHPVLPRMRRARSRIPRLTICTGSRGAR